MELTQEQKSDKHVENRADLNQKAGIGMEDWKKFKRRLVVGMQAVRSGNDCVKERTIQERK